MGRLVLVAARLHIHAGGWLDADVDVPIEGAENTGLASAGGCLAHLLA